MSDVRLLTLYKQHYLDDYSISMKSKITCIGYYDGLDLIKADKESVFGNKSFHKDVADLMEIWYSTGKNAEQLPGGYSNQNIGLFRHSPDKEREKYTAEYWNGEANLPFFAVAFLKLRNSEKYNEAGLNIEREAYKDEIDYIKKICIVLTYCTIDNSDLVVLLKSNSMTKMQNTLDRIDAMDEVIYVHSVLGIEEEYLKDCNESKMIIDIWKNTKCFIDEHVNRIELNMSVCGGTSQLSGIKKILDGWHEQWNITGYQNAVYSYTGGHGNINIKLSGTDIRSLLVLLLPEGFSTHQNPAYTDIIYNIETSLFITEISWKKAAGDLDSRGKQNTAVSVQSDRCRKLIEKCRKFCNNEELKIQDESLYSYYQALIQTLNALDQYERFSMSRDIFDTIYPSFYIFDRKMDAALTEMQNEWNPDKAERLKIMMREYLECVNSVVYHTIHTEQVFLMIPGYSGTSFSIPAKLHLFYLWFVYAVIDLLNDCEKLHSCIVVPVMESRPKTRFIGMDFHNEEKLVHIRLSQRSLFQTGPLMIILAHEMAHYIGRNIRLRELRLDCLLKTMAYYIAEAVCPQEDIGVPVQVKNLEIFQYMKEKLKYEIQMQTAKLFSKKKKRELQNGYYGKDILGLLIKWSIDVFKEDGEDAAVYRLIRSVSEDILTEIRKNEADYVQNMKFVYRIQQYFEYNRKIWQNSGVMQQIVSELLSIYQEVFADMSAIAILGCSREEFQNAFFVSEGNNYDFPIETQQGIREQIADEVVFQKGQKDRHQCGIGESIFMDDDHKISQEMFLKENLPRYVWVNQHIKKYAKKCYKTVLKRLTKNQALSEEVRQVYSLFRRQNSDYDQIFACISKCIAVYKDLVTQIYVQN